MADSPTVHCKSCGLHQNVAEKCRRCHKALPIPVVVQVVEIQDSFGPSAPVLTMADYEKKAMQHALRTAGSVCGAATLLGIGKTTGYRKIVAYGIQFSDGKCEVDGQA